MLELVSVNFDVLPAALLDPAKTHMRVEFTRDDAYIRDCVARAIAEIESACGLSINPAQYRWTTDACVYDFWFDCRNQHLRLPKFPVRSVTDEAGTPMMMVQTDSYSYLPDGARGETYLIDVGYEQIAQMSPAVRNPILLIAATLYETRESLQMGSLNEIPDMARRLLSGLWRPSV